ncbi:MAG: DUF192 domain-containing protein [Acidimicrobiales bacterium]
MRTAWLLREGDVLASAEITEGFVDRTVGLLGRSELDGALLLTRTRSVHTAGVRFRLDVAFLDRDLVVVGTCRLRPWCVAMPRRRACNVLEAAAGSFERWRLRPGDQLEIRETL